MTQGLKVVISPQVLTQQVGDELVLLDLSGEAYFGLDPVGARIWQLLTEGKNVGDVVAQITQEFEVSEQEAHDDVHQLIGELASHQLLILNE